MKEVFVFGGVLKKKCVSFSHPFAACGSFQITRELPVDEARTNELQQTEINTKLGWLTKDGTQRSSHFFLVYERFE